MKNNKKEKYKKIMVVFFGTFVMSIGLNLYILSGKGVDPLSTLLDGLTLYIPISFGTMISIFNVMLLLAIYLIEKEHIGIGSFINAFFLGLFSTLMYKPMLFIEKYPSFIMVFLAILLFPLGISIYMKADYGYGSLEALMTMIAKKSSIKTEYIRTGLDIVFIIIGILLGANFGYGSILAALSTGKLIAFYMKVLG